MPKVSQEHLDRRRQQILDAAADCFAQQGFHATSMQDIFKASELSAGAVYRYFPSKSMLIRAIANEALSTTRGIIDSAIAEAASASAPGPGAAELVTQIVRHMGRNPLARVRPVLLQIWAEAVRDPELGELAKDMLGQLADRLKRLLDMQGETGRLPAGTDTAAVARLLLATIQGYAVQYSIFSEVADVSAAARAAFGAL